MINKNDLEVIKKNSIGNNKKSEYSKQTKNISKKTLSILLAVILSLSITACTEIDTTKEIFYPYSEITDIDYSEVNEYINDNTYELLMILKENNIDLNGNSTVEDYKKIKELSEDDLIVLCFSLGTKECEKIVQAFGYENWDEFLIQNNYTNIKGKPDFTQWQVSEYRKINKIMNEEKTK
ncbi:MAG: hypothetical protein IKL65_02845 [Bacilli bacterium]|nr:hypothetical protein [Bacilli bacterium]